MGGRLARNKIRDCSREENGANGGHFGIEAKEVSKLDEAKCVKLALSSEETYPEFCFYLARIALQTVSKEETKDAKTIVRLIFDSNLDAREHRRPMKKIDDYKQILDYSSDE